MLYCIFSCMCYFWLETTAIDLSAIHATPSPLGWKNFEFLNWKLKIGEIWSCNFVNIEVFFYQTFIDWAHFFIGGNTVKIKSNHRNKNALSEIISYNCPPRKKREPLSKIAPHFQRIKKPDRKNWFSWPTGFFTRKCIFQKCCFCIGRQTRGPNGGGEGV